MGKIINPATDRPFAEAEPTGEIVRLRNKIKSMLSERRLMNKYDGAKNTSQNELHWANADHLSPNAANSLAVRQKLRSRARYESANNGYLKGILLSLANDFTGGGPTLQITDKRFDEQQKEIIERTWMLRSKAIGLRKKLWRLNYAKKDSGEAFGVYYNDISSKHPVKIDFRIFECDHFTHYHFDPKNKYEIDGIRFNPISGKPTQYHMLDQHPGETQLFNLQPMKGRWYDSRDVLHWFRQERAWLRGIPETTPTLPLWAILRRYTLAVLQNAEIAADFTVLLKSVQPASTNPFSLGGDGEPTQAPEDWFESFPIDRGLMTVLPSMYEMDQLDPKQPVTMYDTFVNAIIQEAARPLCIPRNHALGYSGGYNMSSGTLDRQMYVSTIQQERMDCDEEILDKDLEEWWFEGIRTPDYFEDDLVQASNVMGVVNRFRSLRENPPEHTYRWDELSEHTDPVKVAQAINILHMAGHISDIDIQEGRFNRRVEDHYKNLQQQQERREEIGFPTVLMEPIVVDDREDEDD